MQSASCRWQFVAFLFISALSYGSVNVWNRLCVFDYTHRHRDQSTIFVWLPRKLPYMSNWVDFTQFQGHLSRWRIGWHFRCPKIKYPKMWTDHYWNHDTSVIDHAEPIPHTYRAIRQRRNKKTQQIANNVPQIAYCIVCAYRMGLRMGATGSTRSITHIWVLLGLLENRPVFGNWIKVICRVSIQCSLDLPR